MKIDKRYKVNYCFDIYGSIIDCNRKGEKIYKSKKIAKRYIDAWLRENKNNACQTFDFETEKHSLYGTL